MKIYKLPQLAEHSADGGYRLGPESHEAGGVYLFYGRLMPGEQGRKVQPGEGMEEIIYVVKGILKVRRGKAAFTVSAGEAFHAGSDDEFLMQNASDTDSAYVAAGAPSATNRTAQPGTEPPVEGPAPEPPAEEPEEEEDEFEITREDD